MIPNVNRQKNWKNIVIRALENGQLTILVGSAISKYEPTNLPTGSSAVIDIQRCLLEEQLITKRYNEKEINRLKMLIQDLPFETIMKLLQDCTDIKTSQRFIQNTFRIKNYNCVHRIIADWMSEAKGNGHPSLVIITTNYDTGIENAIEKTHANLVYRKIIKEEDTKEPIDKLPILFKIHGNEESGFTFTHDQEANLPQWKKQLLKKFVENRVLLIAGYSGMDLDILPLVLDCKNAKLLLVREVEGLSIGTFQYFEQSIDSRDKDIDIYFSDKRPADLKTTFLELSEISDSSVCREENKNALSGENIDKIRCAINNYLSLDQKMLWLANMIIHCGDWKHGGQILNLHKNKDHFHETMARAYSAFYAGKFLKGAYLINKSLQRTDLHISNREKVDAYCWLAVCHTNAGLNKTAIKELLFHACYYARKMRNLEEKEFQSSSNGNILGRMIFAFPFHESKSFSKIISFFLKRRAAVSVATILRRYAKPTGGNLAFGQTAAKIIEYRYKGSEEIENFEKGKSVDWILAEIWLKEAINIANSINYYPELCKCYLELWYLHLQRNKQQEALECWKKCWKFAEKIEYATERQNEIQKIVKKIEKLAMIDNNSTYWKTVSSIKVLRLGKKVRRLLVA